MGTLAFFPWLKLREDMQIGEFELLRYRRGSLPGGEGTPTQDVCDKILEPYRVGDSPLYKATIVRMGADVDADISDEARDRLYVFSELLPFAGLADREFFRMPYQNRENFRLVVQSFRGTPGGSAIRSRRRDGSTLNYWPADSYTISKPEHIPTDTNTFDSGLMETLLKFQDSDDWGRFFESIVSFNLANTDGPGISEQSEAVLSVSAFERLLDCNRGKEQDLAERFTAALVPQQPIEPSSIRGLSALADSYKRSTSVRDVWIRDFFRVRGHLSHGKLHATHRALWSLWNHLLFASFVFPLLLKCQLAKSGHYELCNHDQQRIDMFEAQVLHDHFTPAANPPDDSPLPWNKVREKAIQERMSRALDKYVEEHGGIPP